MLESRIERYFTEVALALPSAASMLNASVSAGVHALVACVTSGGKVLACGAGVGACDVDRFVALWVGGFERARPELSAVALRSDIPYSYSVEWGDELQNGVDVFARQVRGLGLAGDVLLVLCPQEPTAAIHRAIEAAHEREMVVLAVAAQPSTVGADWLRETDVWVPVSHPRRVRMQELQMLVIHALCDGVDVMLLGDQEVES